MKVKKTMSKKGSLEERQVVKIFEENGYGAIRVPASGSRTNMDKPDVIAGNSRNYYAVEVKSTKNNYIYIRPEQIEELVRFSAKFGAEPLVCAKFTRMPYTVFNPYLIRKTPHNTHVIKREEISKGTPLEEFINRSIQQS